jgi:hypothetical protein
MIGVLLAGGAATRLPNKALLPMKDLRPVCFSGVDYLKRHNVNYIAVITPPNSVIVDILEDYYPAVNFAFNYQAEPTGVGDAINLVKCDKTMGMIVMADNIYPPDEVIHESNMSRPYVVIRQVPAWRLPHLVCVKTNGRFTRSGPGYAALSTPWVINVGEEMFASQEAWPDLQGVARLTMPGGLWWDVGTPETYAAYWRS